MDEDQEERDEEGELHNELEDLNEEKSREKGKQQCNPIHIAFSGHNSTRLYCIIFNLRCSVGWQQFENKNC